MSKYTEWAALAVDILEDSEIMEEFEDGTVWIKVDAEMYAEFQKGEQP